MHKSMVFFVYKRNCFMRGTYVVAAYKAPNYPSKKHSFQKICPSAILLLSFCDPNPLLSS